MKPIPSCFRIPLLAGIALFFWANALTVLAQNNAEVTKIRAVYKEVGDKILECQNANEPEVCRLYLNSLTVNQHNSPWAAVGIYGAVRDFWFEQSENPGENGPAYVLRKLNITSHRSARDQNEEYLFDSEGNLLFYFFKEYSRDDDETTENRFYFKGDKLVEYTEKVDAGQADYQQYHKDDAALILRQAKRLKEFFQGTL